MAEDPSGNAPRWLPGDEDRRNASRCRQLATAIGNVWDWCLDGRRTYDGTNAVDPRGPMDPAPRLNRGGSSFKDDSEARYRAADRFWVTGVEVPSSSVDFRVVCEVGPAAGKDAK